MTKRDFEGCVISTDFFESFDLNCYIEELPTTTPGVIKFAFFPSAADNRKLTPEQECISLFYPLHKLFFGKTNRLKHPRAENALLTAFYFTGSGNHRKKKTGNAPGRSNGASRHLADRYTQVWHEAAEKLMRKLYPISLSPECSRLENAVATYRQKFLIKVAAYCADRWHHGDFVWPEKKIVDDELWSRAFSELCPPLPRRRLIIHDWEIVLINGWISSEYYRMDRYELAAAVNPLLRRKLKVDTLWKYATRELGLDSARTSGPKPGKV